MPATPAPRLRRRLAGLALPVLLVLGTASGCSSKGSSSDAAGSATSTTSTTSAPRRSTTSTTEAGAGGALAPRRVPAGWKALADPRLDVAVAVPGGWDQREVDPEDVSGAVDDSGFGAGLGAASSMLGDAVVIAADGGADGTVTVLQLGVSLPTVPASLGEQATSQLEQMGARKVRATSVRVPGLDPDVRGLLVSAEVRADGRWVATRSLLIPASRGLASVSVRADRVTADRVLASVTAR